MYIWEVLGIEPTTDIVLIKRAFAQKAKKYHPEEYPEEYKNLRSVYKKAIEYAKQQGGQTASLQSVSGGAEPYTANPMGTAELYKEPPKLKAAQIEDFFREELTLENLRREKNPMEQTYLESPHLEKPYLESPRLESPYKENPYQESPYKESPYLKNPHLETPYMETPHIEMPHLETPKLEMPHREETVLERPRIREKQDEEPLETPYLETHKPEMPHLKKKVAEKPFVKKQRWEEIDLEIPRLRELLLEHPSITPPYVEDPSLLQSSDKRRRRSQLQAIPKELDFSFEEVERAFSPEELEEFYFSFHAIASSPILRDNIECWNLFLERDEIQDIFRKEEVCHKMIQIIDKYFWGKRDTLLYFDFFLRIKTGKKTDEMQSFRWECKKLLGMLPKGNELKLLSPEERTLHHSILADLRGRNIAYDLIHFEAARTAYLELFLEEMKEEREEWQQRWDKVQKYHAATRALLIFKSLLGPLLAILLAGLILFVVIKLNASP